MADALLRVEGLKKSFDGTQVLRDLSFEVGRGEFVTLLGPSGCGKTTTLRIIAGLLAPDAGRVVLSGSDITDAPPEKRPLNTVFQNYALFPHMNVEKNISYGLRMRGMKKAEWRPKVEEMLRLVQLEGCEKRMPGQLSGGQCQRVAIARAIVGKPKLLLADEPTGALDSASGAAVMELFRQLHESGSTIIMITHDRSIAKHAAKLMTIRDGVLSGGDDYE